MKALTICQPYAHLICTGEKRVENRTWPTPFRGRLLIHAGKSRSWLNIEQGPNGERDDEYLIPLRAMAFGAIVGVADMVACLEYDGKPPEELQWVETHEHSSGPWCWVLANVKRFGQPIPYRGAQGLFDVPDDVVADAINCAMYVPVLPS